MPRHRVRGFRHLAQGATLLMLLPLLLSACGSDAATSLPATVGSVATTIAGGRAATAVPAAPTVATNATAPVTTVSTMAAAGSAPASGTVAGGAASTAAGSTTVAGTPAAPLQLSLPATSKRGAGGNLRLLWWQAPTILNAHLSQGTKDFDAARPVIEPLASITFRSTIPDVPVLAKEIPSMQNGELAADGTAVTWKLKEGVVWSDGQPFTADDVVFTWQFVTDPKSGAATVADYETIKDVTAVDATTVKITFKAATPLWYLPFVGSRGDILPKHILAQCGDAKACPFNLKPIGTGPYVVTDFKPGDTVLYTANEKFREPNAPFFANVEMKGGGDAVTALKAVQTGQADFAWNPQVTPDLFKQFTDSGQTLNANPGASAESIYVNFADPATEVDGEKSSPKSKNPVLTDKSVRQAIATAIDRDAMAKNLYGPAGVAANTTIPGIYTGPEWKYDPKQANALLDAAGWKPGPDGIRAKDGKKITITLRTTVNSVRDKESILIQQNLKAIGIDVQLKPVDAAVFFGQPDNPDNRARFESDLEIVSDGPGSPDAQGWLSQYTSDKASAKANGWKGTNYMRWSNADYDAAIKELSTTLDPMKRVELAKKADAILIGDYAQIPLVARTSLAAYAKGIVGVYNGSWDSNVWNIAHWTRGG